MSGYIGSKASVVTPGAERKKVFAITTTTTSLTGLNYTVGFVHVYHNGIRLVDGTDYTATNGTSITLTNAALNGDEVVVISYASFQTSDTVSASAGGTFSNDVTITGDLTVGTNLDVSSGTIKLDGNYPVGTGNVALGNAALDSNVSGASNTAIGADALTANTASNNTAVGYQAMYTNTTGTGTAVGRYALYYSNGAENVAVGGNTGTTDAALQNTTTGSYNTAMGVGALRANTTASNNTAVGYQAGYSGTTAADITAIGYIAGKDLTTGNSNTFVGAYAGENVTTGNANTSVGRTSLRNATSAGSNTAVGSDALELVTGSGNTAIGQASGSLITTGAYNTILGRYNGNQGGLDIRTSSNNIVLSDGDGNPRMYYNSAGWRSTKDLSVSPIGGYRSIVAKGDGSVNAEGWNGASTALYCGRVTGTGRSINASGTINASGADYAEYMVKVDTSFTIQKGDICGIDVNGKLTNVWNDAISFVVKSTDPSYVGGDVWGVDLEGDALEAARQTVDRIAFSGQVPVNVIGATVGDFIVPIQDGTGITGQAISSPTLEQYMSAVGKVIAIEDDGRARIIVKVA